MDERYTLAELYKKGQINYSVIMFRDIKEKVNGLIKTGMSNGQAVILVAEEMNMSRQSIYNAIKKAL